MDTKITILPYAFQVEVTVTATPTLFSDLVAAQLTARDLVAAQIIFAYFMPKVTAGTDRGAIRMGSASDTMFMHFGTGQLAAPPILGDLYVERVGGSDVPAVVVVGWQP